MRIYLGADHAGFETKNVIAEHLKATGHEVVDCAGGAGSFTLRRRTRKPSAGITRARRRAMPLTSSGTPATCAS